MANLIDDRNVRSRNLMFQIPAECVIKRFVPLSRALFSGKLYALAASTFW